MSFIRILCLMVCILKVFSKPTISPEMVGGNDVLSATTYPYQVSIQDLYNNHKCGGSIIDTAWVLTAAHCIHSDTVYLDKIVAGTIDRTNGVTKSISLAIKHPDHHTKSISLTRKHYHLKSDNSNDIAVVRIVGSFTYTDNIQPIKLANGLPEPGSYANLTGWGLTSHYSSKPPIHLQFLLVRVIEMSICEAFYGSGVTNTNVCTLNTIGEGACFGDSGSPLAFNNEQIGIVSFGMPCAKGYPDVYTNVPAFKKWISETTGIKF